MVLGISFVPCDRMAGHPGAGQVEGRARDCRQPVATVSLCHGVVPNGWDQYMTLPGLVLIAVITIELLVTATPGYA